MTSVKLWFVIIHGDPVPPFWLKGGTPSPMKYMISYVRVIVIIELFWQACREISHLLLPSSFCTAFISLIIWLTVMLPKAVFIKWHPGTPNHVELSLAKWCQLDESAQCMALTQAVREKKLSCRNNKIQTFTVKAATYCRHHQERTKCKLMSVHNKKSAKIILWFSPRVSITATNGGMMNSLTSCVSVVYFLHPSPQHSCWVTACCFKLLFPVCQPFTHFRTSLL